MIQEFGKFLKEFNVAALAIGFVMGTASTALVNSLVKDIVMPLIEPLMFAENWSKATLVFGPVKLAYGSFIAELVNFLILALVIFLVARKLLKLETPPKKEP